MRFALGLPMREGDESGVGSGRLLGVGPLLPTLALGSVSLLPETGRLVLVRLGGGVGITHPDA